MKSSVVRLLLEEEVDTRGTGDLYIVSGSSGFTLFVHCVLEGVRKEEIENLKTKLKDFLK